MGKKVWHPDKIGFTHDAWLAKRVSYFPPTCAPACSTNVFKRGANRLLGSLLLWLLRYNHSGRIGLINFLNGVMGIANAQRGLEYIRVITEFISYVITGLFALFMCALTC